MSIVVRTKIKELALAEGKQLNIAGDFAEKLRQGIRTRGGFAANRMIISIRKPGTISDYLRVAFCLLQKK